ncbi:hypothetical protein RJ640_019039 [Escallonia rubra]|uniref:DUF7356 domain-containing protein n=1 Tax=Escallonia rubra TaxID=112253 RepID=A0AA88U189_9ASTE|nr:hypothetical protein RJ640_019039 [Escallonia rubra]
MTVKGAQKSSLISNQKESLDGKTGQLELDSTKVDPVKEGGKQGGGSTEKSNLDKRTSSEHVKGKDAQNLQTKEDPSKQAVSKEAQNAQTNTHTVAKEGPKETAIEGSKNKEVSEGGKSLAVQKGSYQSEECDSSNSCMDEKNSFVACLKVPGNESPEFLLLIQNKGKDPLTVKISAPTFVRPEKTQVQLQGKEGKQVKVSIRNGGTDNLINLAADSGNCSLDIKDLIAESYRKEAGYTSNSTGIPFKRTPVAVVIFLVATLVVVASILVFVKYWQFSVGRSGSNKYQKLDMELPVTAGGKKESDVSDVGWDDSWGDTWDDEEAPNTPSMPLTPSLSTKGIASRRINKDGWKD